MSLMATLFPKEYTPEFTVLRTRKHTQFTEKPPKPAKKEACPFKSRTKEAGEWYRNQTLDFLREKKKKMTIYAILGYTLRAQSAQQKTLNDLIFDGLVLRTPHNQNKSVPVLYWAA
jgi:hypothetical protein